MKDFFYTGLDIGTHMMRVVILHEVNGQGLQMLSNAEIPSRGISKGTVVDIEDVVTTLSEVLETAERMTGRPVTHATVGISGAHITTQESRGVVAISRADGEIKEDDVDRVIEAAQAVASPPNYEVLHVIPLYFTVDNHTHVRDPLGMTGVRLETNIQIVLGLSSEIKNVTKAVYRTGLEVNDLVVGILACAESVLTKQHKELGVALVNIGASTTAMAVFEDSNLMHVSVIPIGSAHITSDLAIGLRTSVDAAEKIKIDIGKVGSTKIEKHQTIDVSKYSLDASDDPATLSDVYKIIEARLEELFDRVNQKLSSIGRAGRLPAGIVFTGGGAYMPGIVAFAKDHFKLPISLGYPLPLDNSLEKSKLLQYSCAIGLALWDKEWRAGSARSGLSVGAHIPIIGTAFNKVKKIFK